MTSGDLFLIAGGRESRRCKGDPLLAGIFSLIGLEHPVVAYVGAASNDSRVFFLWIAAMLKKAGADSVPMAALASKRADLAKALSLLERSDVVFVSGGDVELGMNVLQRTGASGVLKKLHQAGKPFIGLSAGSIMLARNWVRWTDPGDDRTAEEFPCLGLAPVLCDTHAEKEGWEELKVLLQLLGAPVGYGIPAGAALRVAAGGSLAAIGRPVQRLVLKESSTARDSDLPVS
jgi:cyanophycinase-like exopeptidase